MYFPANANLSAGKSGRIERRIIYGIHEMNTPAKISNHRETYQFMRIHRLEVSRFTRCED